MKKTEIKAKWLHELRHGGHEQVPGTLKVIKEDGSIGYCCLGVLEEKVLNHPVDTYYAIEDDLTINYEGPTETYIYLKEVIIGSGELVDQYTDKNDNGWTFPEIADYIERTWNPDDKETVE